MSKRESKGSWIVTLRAVVTYSVVCDDCTEDDARNEPFSHAVEEHVEDLRDWEVERVEAND